jgi:acetolactate synthase-1/2/3 large subunit/5-guanidino-2-oxopentanoate decarboxylase
MGQAYSDSVPMLVISSCLDETAATRGQLHQMKDQRAAAATVCDWSEEARTAEAAYTLIDRALTEWTVQRHRPKHIQIPIHQLVQTAQPAPPPPLAPRRMEESIWRRVVLQELLLEAKKPIFVFGGGMTKGYALDIEGFEPNWLREFRKLNAASFTTYAGRGVIPPDFPLYLGSYLARPSSKQVFEDADLVVAVGTELAEVDLWRKSLGYSGHFVRIDLDPEPLIDANQAVELIQADGVAHLESTILDMKDLPKTEWSQSEVNALRTKWRAEVDAERPGIVPVADALKDCLPEGTMIYSDMCQFAYAAKEVWDMDLPGHWHHPTGFGTLGYATPAAIGGAVARPGLPTMAIIGDYGFQYTVQELATAVELNLPLPIFLWDNGKLGEIEDSMVRAQIAPNAVHQRNPDFIKLAEAYGAYAAAPTSLAEMQSAVRQAFDSDGPTVIRVTPDISP